MYSEFHEGALNNLVYLSLKNWDLHPATKSWLRFGTNLTGSLTRIASHNSSKILD